MQVRFASRGDHRVRRIVLLSAREPFASAAGGSGAGAPAQGGANSGAGPPAPQAAAATVAARSFYRFNASESRDAAADNANASALDRTAGAYTSFTEQRRGGVSASGGIRSRLAGHMSQARDAGTCDQIESVIGGANQEQNTSNHHPRAFFQSHPHSHSTLD